MLESWIIALPTSHDHIVCLNITSSIPLSSKSYWWWFFDFGIVTGMLTFAGNNTTFTATAFTFGDFFGWVGKATHFSIGSNTFGKLLLLIVGNTSASFFCSPTSTFCYFPNQSKGPLWLSCQTTKAIFVCYSSFTIISLKTNIQTIAIATTWGRYKIHVDTVVISYLV